MDIQIFIGNIGKSLGEFYHSGFFLTIKILLGIYAAVLFIDIILLLIQRGVSGNIREFTTGMSIPLALTKKRKETRKKWLAIKRKLESKDENEYKVAIIEADEMIGKIVAGLDYPGKNFGEQLDNIPEGQIPNVDGLKMAHKTRNRIIHDDKFPLKKAEAQEALAQFEEFLDYFLVFK